MYSGWRREVWIVGDPYLQEVLPVQKRELRESASQTFDDVIGFQYAIDGYA